MSDIREPSDIGQTAPDYPLDEQVMASTPEQFKALGDPIRRTILDLVLERAATTSELAEALGRPRGTVDHHLKVLEHAGLMRVVRTRKVRAMTEKFWGRTARTIVFGSASNTVDRTLPRTNFLTEALDEIGRGPDLGGDECTSSLRHARVPAERAAEFSRRLGQLAVEFVEEPRAGDIVYGLVYALYATTLPVLRAPKDGGR